MMKRIFLFIVIVVFFLCFVKGQDEDFYRLSWENLPSKYDRKKERVENLLGKSSFYLEKAGKVENKLKKYKTSGNTNPMRQLALQERVYRLYLKAYSFVEDANRIQFSVIDEMLENKGLTGNEEMEVEFEKQFTSSAVLRRKGESVVPGMNPKSFLAEATEMESEVLGGMEKLLSGQTVEMGTATGDKDSALVAEPKELVSERVEIEIDTVGVVSQASVKEQPESSISTRAGADKSLENEASVKPEEKNAVETTETDVSTEKSGEVFYSIQFLATREEVSNKQVEEIYNGNLPVIENRSDGWYRFSAGKFGTISEATAEMKKAGIHGFVVAFNGNERISISEAKRLK